MPGASVAQIGADCPEIEAISVNSRSTSGGLPQLQPNPDY
jgi:hypothetical protein